MGAAMMADKDAFESLSDRIRRLSEAADARFRTTWSEIGSDVVATVVSTADAGDVMTVRISDDGALLDINDSNAIEFAADGEDATALMAVVEAFFHSELELIVGAKDDTCYGVRVGEVELTSSEGLVGRLRSGGRRVRAMR